MADRDIGSRILCCPKNHLARHAILRNQIDIGATRGNRYRLVEIFSEHDRRHTIRIVVMRIDQIKVVTFIDDPADFRLDCTRKAKRRQRHAEFRQQRITRM